MKQSKTREERLAEKNELRALRTAMKRTSGKPQTSVARDIETPSPFVSVGSKPSNRSPVTPHQIVSQTRVQLLEEERFRRVMDLRRSGTSLSDILESLVAEFGRDSLPPGYSVQHIAADISSYMTLYYDRLGQTTNELRALELDRLDQLLLGIWRPALNGNLKAIDRALKISELRSRLAGLFAPTSTIDWKIEVRQLLDSGVITLDQVRRELGDELAIQVIQTPAVSKPVTKMLAAPKDD